MKILLLLANIFAFSWLAGWVTVVLLQAASLYQVRAIRLTVAVVGYAPILRIAVYP
jgi:hypothetical protein